MTELAARAAVTARNVACVIMLHASCHVACCVPELLVLRAAAVARGMDRCAWSRMVSHWPDRPAKTMLSMTIAHATSVCASKLGGCCNTVSCDDPSADAGTYLFSLMAVCLNSILLSLLLVGYKCWVTVCAATDCSAVFSAIACSGVWWNPGVTRAMDWSFTAGRTVGAAGCNTAG